MAAVALASATSANANLLVNGSFEAVPGNYLLLGGGSNAIAGWTTTGEGVEWFDPASAYGIGTAHSGTSIVDLAWFISNGTPGGGIAQSFATTVGQRYQVSFYGVNSTLAGRDGTGIVDAYINGSLLSSNAVNHPSLGWLPSDWQLFTANFTATSAMTALEFRNTQDANLHFAFIDSASVVAVPEPASWALMIFGFGAVGAAARRRAAFSNSNTISNEGKAHA